jgi:hypothetical protein
LGGGGGGATLLAANTFSFSISMSSIFSPCFFFLRINKKINPTIKPTPRITPIAIPAFAPPVRPSGPEAPGTEVAEAEGDACVAAASSNPVLAKEEVEEVAVENVVITVGVLF